MVPYEPVNSVNLLLNNAELSREMKWWFAFLLVYKKNNTRGDNAKCKFQGSLFAEYHNPNSREPFYFNFCPKIKPIPSPSAGEIVYSSKDFKPGESSTWIIAEKPWFKIECVKEQDKITNLERRIYTYYMNENTIDHLRIEIADCGTKGEGLAALEIYYYQIVSEGVDPLALPDDTRASAMATVSHNTGETLYNRLPAIYKKLDERYLSEKNYKMCMDAINLEFRGYKLKKQIDMELRI